ncbi:MAG TPA: nucleotide exchange factor GrpE [Solirubrobacterales bacterium]|jgi:molecular chaperone GrpE|nr:nucleotide exchange factor GrpE [Solirubrobacterales bacterium]
MTDTTDILRDGTDGHGEASAGSGASFGRTNTDPADAETVTGSGETNPPAASAAGGPPTDSGNGAFSDGGEVTAEQAEQAVEQDLDDLLTATTRERDEYLDLARRAQADFENFRKRASKDLADSRTKSVAGVARELLPVVDNFDRAVEAAGLEDATVTADNSDALAEGIRLVHRDLHSVLDRLGLTPIDPIGEKFDPGVHEAVASVPQEGTEPGIVTEVAQKGFKLGEIVVRPARVVVSA